MRAWMDIATLDTFKNHKQSFIAHTRHDVNFAFKEGMKLFFVPPQFDAPRSARVLSARAVKPFTYEITLDAVCDVPTGHLLEGCHLLVDRRVADEASGVVKNSSLDTALLQPGWAVYEENGEYIGKFVSFIKKSVQTLLEVEHTSGKTVLIPNVRELIVKIDEENCSLTVSLPDGLLDL